MCVCDEDYSSRHVSLSVCHLNWIWNATAINWITEPLPSIKLAIVNILTRLAFVVEHEFGNQPTKTNAKIKWHQRIFTSVFNYYFSSAFSINKSGRKRFDPIQSTYQNKHTFQFHVIFTTIYDSEMKTKQNQNGSIWLRHDDLQENKQILIHISIKRTRITSTWFWAWFCGDRHVPHVNNVVIKFDKRLKAARIAGGLLFFACLGA